MHQARPSWEIFLDVDGVLLDYERSFVSIINQLYQINLPSNYQSANWSYTEVLTQEQTEKAWQKLLDSKEFSNMSPLVEPEKLNQAFMGYPVHLISNIPPDYESQRLRNLNQLGFRFNSFHCGGFISYQPLAKKSKGEIIKELVGQNQSVLFVDDHPLNCESVCRHIPNAEVWLFDRLFNQDYQGYQNHQNSAIKRMKGWDEALPQVAKIIATIAT